MRPLKDGAEGWVDGLVNKVLPLQTCRTEFSLQLTMKDSGLDGCISIPGAIVTEAMDAWHPLATQCSPVS